MRALLDVCESHSVCPAWQHKHFRRHTNNSHIPASRLRSIQSSSVPWVVNLWGHVAEPQELCLSILHWNKWDLLTKTVFLRISEVYSVNRCTVIARSKAQCNSYMVPDACLSTLVPFMCRTAIPMQTSGRHQCYIIKLQLFQLLSCNGNQIPKEFEPLVFKCTANCVELFPLAHPNQAVQMWNSVTAICCTWMPRLPGLAQDLHPFRMATAQYLPQGKICSKLLAASIDLPGRGLDTASREDDIHRPVCNSTTTSWPL